MRIICGRLKCQGKADVKKSVVKFIAIAFTFIFILSALSKCVKYSVDPNSSYNKAKAAKIIIMNGESEKVYNSHQPILREEVMLSCIQKYSNQYPTDNQSDAIQTLCEKLIPKTGTFEVAEHDWCSCSSSSKCEGFNGYLFLVKHFRICTAYYVK